MSDRLRATVALLLDRDLSAMMREVESYPDDEGPWRALPGIPNAAGTLALHVAGNLRHVVGTVLGGGPYVRDREREFAARDLTRAELVTELSAARAEVARVLPGLPDAAIAPDRLVPMRHWQVPADRLLLHLVTHTAYHLGQADLHRRLVTGHPAGIGAVGLDGLASAAG